MKFEEIIIPYVSDTKYLEAHIDEMIKVMNSKEIPKSDESCENCAYSAQFNNL